MNFRARDLSAKLGNERNQLCTGPILYSRGLLFTLNNSSTSLAHSLKTTEQVQSPHSDFTVLPFLCSRNSHLAGTQSLSLLMDSLVTSKKCEGKVVKFNFDTYRFL